jgi:beta-lactamase regulating signal transducer with metallopeptidase domain
VISSIVQTTLVAAVALLLVRIGARWSPAAREALIAVALAKFLVPASLIGWGVFAFTTSFVANLLDMPLSRDGVSAGRWDLAVAALRSVHAAGVLIVAVRLAFAWRSCRRLLAGSTRVRGGPLMARGSLVVARLGMRRMPAMWVSPEADAPLAFGLVRRHVIVPASLSEESMNVVLAHELAHHRRGDLWKIALHRVVVALWWWNPLAWALGTSLREAIEDGADDLVLAAGIASEERYARVLLECARTAAPAERVALGMATRRHPLARRLVRLSRPRRAPSWRTIAGTAAFALLLLPGVPKSTDSDETTVLRAIHRDVRVQVIETQQVR